MALVAGLAVLVLPATTVSLRAQSQPALTGQVTSAEEGPMEGVLVSAKRAGSTLTITVVSDASGRYSFPAAKLEPGQYALTVRAVGYDLDAQAPVQVAPQQAATADLKLHRTQDLASQLSNAEWLISMPGTDEQKKPLLNCVGCHTLARPVTSQHDAAEFVEVLQRMAGYAQMSTPLHPQRRVEELPTAEGPERLRKQAEFLSTVNLGAGEQWKYPLKTLPRPSGRATQVIVTEYDLPRDTSQPHDVIVDGQGIVWYSNFGEPFLSRLDPKTGKVTEYPVPVLKKDSPVGMLDLQPDAEGNLWFGLMYQAAIGKFDKKTETIQLWSLPPEMNSDISQVNMVQPRHAGVDGKVWTNDNGLAGLHRLDLATGAIETLEPNKDIGGVRVHNLYDIASDSRNNVFFTDLNTELMGRVDAKTKEVTFYKTPTPRAGTRRGMMDEQDRFWFAEYRGEHVGMLDTRTGQIQEWAMPTPWTAPYDVAVDRNGELWTAGMTSDRVVRLDPKSGQTTEYLLPRETNVRRVFVDSSTTPVTFWVGNNHGTSVVKVEPLN
jgi:streptogramin lyase